MCVRNSSGVQRSSVRSQIVAFAPFSQNSNLCGSAGLAQAQALHMCPSGLFMRISVCTTPRSGRSFLMSRSMPLTEPQPPVGSS